MHFPTHKPKEMDWTFAGQCDNLDKALLQYGLKIYKEVCSACYPVNLVVFTHARSARLL